MINLINFLKKKTGQIKKAKLTSYHSIQQT